MDTIHPGIGAGEDWPALAAELDQAAASRFHVTDRLPALAADPPLPQRRPATELRYRLVAGTRGSQAAAGSGGPASSAADLPPDRAERPRDSPGGRGASHPQGPTL